MSQDESQCRETFPSEVWKWILENVNDSKNYNKISSASPYFRSHLYPRASQILFPNIMQLLIKNSIDQRVLPWIQTRQVCHAWKKGLDKMLCKQEYFVQRNDERLTEMRGIASDVWTNPMNFVSFELAEDFADFENHFDSTHLGSRANPFLLRKVVLFIAGANLEDYYTACGRFFNKYGHHVRSCIIAYHLHEQDAHTDLFSRRLQAILWRMPILQALQLQNLGDLHQEEPLPEVDCESLPRLPFLEYICLEESPDAVVEELVDMNPQVKYVDALCCPLVQPLVIIDWLPELRHVGLRLLHESDVLKLGDSQYTSRVERLWLDLEDLCDATSEGVFQALQRRFSDTLVALHLRLPRGKCIGASARLVLPHLKIIYLEMEQPQRLDFLLPLRDTLEELHLGLDNEVASEVNCQLELLERSVDENHYTREFQLYKFWKEPQKCNVWSFFQNLGVLELKIFKAAGEMPEKYSCTRKEWQAEIKAE